MAAKEDSIYMRGALFDRLVDNEPENQHVSASLKTLSVKELKDSIRREISWLLNTRCTFSQDALAGVERSVVDYGIPDFSCFFPDNNENRKKLTRAISDVIEAYEPQLKNVDVEVKDDEGQVDKFSLSLLIKANVIINQVPEPITFIMDVG